MTSIGLCCPGSVLINNICSGYPLLILTISSKQWEYCHSSPASFMEEVSSACKVHIKPFSASFNVCSGRLWFGTSSQNIFALGPNGSPRMLFLSHQIVFKDALYCSLLDNIQRNSSPSHKATNQAVPSTNKSHWTKIPLFNQLSIPACHIVTTASEGITVVQRYRVFL